MKNKPTILIAAALTLAVMASPAFAQEHRRPRRGIDRGATLPAAADTVTLTGTVVSFTAEPSLGLPTLVVDVSGTEYTFVLGPYRYLVAQGFEATAGDAVEVIATECLQCERDYTVVQVTNLTTGDVLLLREDGKPTWRSHGNSQSGLATLQDAVDRGNGGMVARIRDRLCDGGLPDLSQVTTYEGTVSAFAGEPGLGLPILTLTTADGDVDIVVSPYWVLLAAGVTYTEGQSLSVVAAPVIAEGGTYWVALSITDLATGFTLEFRDPATGRPIGTGPNW